MLSASSATIRTCAAAVCNWRRRRKKFPTKYYPVMRDELKKRRAKAPDDLWGFYKKKS